MRVSEAPASSLGPVADAAESAKQGGLRYVRDDTPGIHRTRCGSGFRYIDEAGKPVSQKDRERIVGLAIPPAWTNVWICPTATGHIQASGRDARGRKQYRYHPRWREVRDEAKFNRMLAFGRKLPAIRARTERDLARRGLPREKVLATVVRLLETTLIRVGNEEYAKTNHSYGMTTLRNHHIESANGTVRFTFRGKGGKRVTVEAHDRRLARVVRQCQDLPGHELFEYVDPTGAICTIESSDVNAYLREITGEDFTAKDFRTWFGTLLFVRALRAQPRSTPTKRAVIEAIEATAQQLRNTRSVCRNCYVHPDVIECYLGGNLPPLGARESEEKSLMALLDRVRHSPRS